MAVNTNFYKVANELMSRAQTGTVSTTQVVDYATFIDAGKALSSLSYQDLQNSFVPYVMNKVQKTIQDNPAYMGQLLALDKGKLDYGIVEVLVDDFYSASPSYFDGNTIAAGNSYDPYKIENLLNTKGNYYTDSNSLSFDVSIRDTDLKGIFTSPEAFDGFIRKCFTSLANSIEQAREDIRLALIAQIIKNAAAESAINDDENKCGVNYNLLAIYNAEKTANLDYESAQLSNDFVSWSTGVIRDVRGLMAKPSKKFSKAGDVVTFTPDSYCMCLINGVYDKAIRRSLIDAYNKENGMIDFEHEVLPYWQNISDRLRVTTNATPSGSDPIVTTYSPYVVGVLMDRRAAGVLTNLEDATTDRNGKYRYTSYHYQFNWMLYVLKSANTVIFTLGSAT